MPGAEQAFRRTVALHDLSFSIKKIPSPACRSAERADENHFENRSRFLEKHGRLSFFCLQ